METLQGKIALVTGASSGIGRATAIALAKEECSVIVNFRSNARAAKATVNECDRHSTGNIAIRADVSKESDVAGMFRTVRKRFSHLDILVNNAGIFDETDSATNIAAFENVYRNNFLSCVLVTKYALPLMKTGKIVNVSSIHARLGHGRPGAIAYSAFKAALENYTENLAKVVAPRILVNAVAPGRVATAMWGDLKPARQKKLGRVHLIKRMIQPEEIASGVVFLAKNDAACGEVLTIDGGMSLVTLG
jgi:3-oxoacyl-[acyl-carrier protein] reductase